MSLKSILLDLDVEEGITETGIEGLEINRLNRPYSRTSKVNPPSVSFNVQGEKTIYLGKQKITYDEKNYLIRSAKMPVESELKEASPSHPYLSILLKIEPTLISELLVEMDDFINWPKQNTTDYIITSAPFDDDLKESLIRLLSIIKDSLKVKALGKSLLRELYFYILKGERGYVLRNCVLHHAKAHKIVPIIQYLERNFKNPIEIDDLAKFAAMSNSALHEKFKAATSLSPIQFIKKLRLHHAHNLLLEGKSAGEAAFDSGYGNQSQFSREFKRQFGCSPRDIRAAFSGKL